MAWLSPEDRARVIGTRVGGRGKVPARVMCVGEFPGVDEGVSGKPFVGKSGREFRRYLNGYELPLAEDMWLTNLSKTVAKDMKSSTVTEDDEAVLWREIYSVQPEIIVTLGHRVTQYFLGDVTLEAVHGIPHHSAVLHAHQIGGTVILPAYNPAAALYAPGLQAFFALDMKYLSLLLKGKLPPAPVDERPGTYVLADDRTDIGFRQLIASDTEGWPDRPWCLSWSGAPYTGAVVRTGTPGLAAWIETVKRVRPRVVLHNSLHDLGMYRVFGLDLDAEGVQFDDTMIMAYLLGLEPQGLKPLAYRHAGMLQDDYADLVADAAEAGAFEWLYKLSLTLPTPARKLKTKGELKTRLAALGLAVPTDWTAVPYYDVDGELVRALDPAREELAHCRTLIERMIAKPGKLSTRWANCTAREVLLDDLQVLSPYDCDPLEPSLDAISLEQAVNYAARDADATLRVFPRLDRQIDAMGLRDVYATDIACVPLVERMQYVGLKADLEHFRSLSVLFEIEAAENQNAIRALIGRPINPNSGDQVAELLFDELQIHKQVANLRLKKTKSGDRFSTNDKVLDALKGTHPVVALIQDGREIRKLKGTYADPMPMLIGRDGRLHPRYRLTRTDTGRLSAGDPNVLAFPKHSVRGKLIRMGFLADEGHELGEWDLSQIEMCVFAHDSGDERMIAEINSGVDKHASTASRIFGRPADIIYREAKAGEGRGGHERFAAKAVNFGILMGITEFGLLDQFHKNGQLDWTLDRCRELLTTWLDAYPGGAAYISRKHTEARRYGYVRDMWGRLRWLEGIHSDDDYIRAEAERMAQATPVQSGAQGIIKRVMAAVWPVLKALRTSFWVEPLLQVHDALITEHDSTQRTVVDDVMMTAMTTTVQLRVPVKADRTFGQRWGEL